MTKPSLRDRLRPLELLGLSAILALFTGGVMIFTTRSWPIASIGFGVAFIVSVMVLAMLALVAKPDDAERLDIDEQDRDEQGRNKAKP